MKFWLFMSSAMALLVTLICLSLYFGTTAEASSINLLVVLLGLALGWLLGILASPYSKTEEESFNKYASAFGVFASGYLVGKADRTIDLLLSPAFILESKNGFRAMALLTSLLVGFLMTFEFRRYGQNGSPKQELQPVKDPIDMPTLPLEDHQ
jgi:positive regulator of sigma E activity